MLDGIAEYEGLADENGYAGFGYPEHHLRIEGFEIANGPAFMGCGSASTRASSGSSPAASSPPPTTHHPLRTAESIATMDNTLGGRIRTRGAGRRAPGHLTCNHTEG